MHTPSGNKIPRSLSAPKTNYTPKPEYVRVPCSCAWMESAQSEQAPRPDPKVPDTPRKITGNPQEM
jgi:hypothetical protein